MVTKEAVEERQLQIFTQWKAANWPARTGAGPSVLKPNPVVSGPVAWWHVQLGSIALLNLVLWALSAAAVTRGQTLIPAESDAACVTQLLLSAAYMLGCAFRSVLPVYDIPRIVLIDSQLSSVIVGRSVATIAEMCFAAQWALILHRIALVTHSPLAYALSLAIVPLIILAEVCSWHSVLTTDQRGHMAENSLWGLSAVLVVISLAVIGPSRLGYLYLPMIAWSVGGAFYAAYIFFFDVPMYWTRWRADKKNGRRYLSIAQGVVDVRVRRVVSYTWKDWKNEILWMSLYFSFGVWSSISLVYASITLNAHGL
jgi:hypothetical protein